MYGVEDALITVAYLVAAVLFILSLGGLSSQETARRGNMYGMVGMGIAVAATLSSSLVGDYGIVAVALGIGAVIGVLLSARIAMTAMPELVALLHSFVGIAAILVGVSAYLGGHSGAVTLIEIWVDVAIASITFSGSIIAFLKLRGSMTGRPLLLPGRHFLNLGMILAVIALAVPFLQASGPESGLPFLLAMTAVTVVLGVHLVVAIGGADMPVVVSMLNSYSGWTAAAAGFVLSNDLLIVTGALVGSSGFILSVIMCRAMNRSIVNVIFGGFGTAGSAVPAKSSGAEAGEVAEIDVSGVCGALLKAKSVIIVPGYGMAVARAQHTVREMTTLLKERGTEVRFAIHPVAGRLPGHMNVLLAEAQVPYPIVLEMDHINGDFPDTDVVLVIGANDIVNPGAQTDESSPIYGMPVLEVWKSKLVVMMKRTRASGYAGVDNPLFYDPATRMLFGDALESMSAIVAGLRDQAGSAAA